MEKAVLAALVTERLTQRAIAERLGLSQTAVRYWLRRHELPTWRAANGRRRPGSYRLGCGNCGETDPEKFYGRKYSLCGKCHNLDVMARGRQKRLRAIEFLGGKCMACGYNRYYGALDFHHREPGTKDPTFACLRGWSWERIVAELAKCDLLCRNCHAERHEQQRRDVAQVG